MKRIVTVSNLRIGVEILLIIALFMVALSHNLTNQASAQEEPSAPTALYWYQCNAPNHAGVFTDRVHIFCTSITPVASAPALDGISWFAFPTTSDPATASRFMSIMQSSVITGKLVWVEVNPTDTSGSTFGCGASNCRRVYGIELR